MARQLGVSKATVQRVWNESEIKPHLTRVFQLSTDPGFEVKFGMSSVFTSILQKKQWCSVVTRKPKNLARYPDVPMSLRGSKTL